MLAGRTMLLLLATVSCVAAGSNANGHGRQSAISSRSQFGKLKCSQLRKTRLADKKGDDLGQLWSRGWNRQKSSFVEQKLHEVIEAMGRKLKAKLLKKVKALRDQPENWEHWFSGSKKQFYNRVMKDIARHAISFIADICEALELKVRLGGTPKVLRTLRKQLADEILEQIDFRSLAGVWKEIAIKAGKPKWDAKDMARSVRRDTADALLDTPEFRDHAMCTHYSPKEWGHSLQLGDKYGPPVSDDLKEVQKLWFWSDDWDEVKALQVEIKLENVLEKMGAKMNGMLLKLEDSWIYQAGNANNWFFRRQDDFYNSVKRDAERFVMSLVKDICIALQLKARLGKNLERLREELAADIVGQIDWQSLTEVMKKIMKKAGWDEEAATAMVIRLRNELTDELAGTFHTHAYMCKDYLF